MKNKKTAKYSFLLILINQNLTHMVNYSLLFFSTRPNTAINPKSGRGP